MKSLLAYYLKEIDRNLLLLEATKETEKYKCAVENAVKIIRKMVEKDNEE